MSDKDGWHFRQGDAITPELTAMRLLGGGAAYEAYLAFDEVTYGPVVVKVVRPDQVADEQTLRGLAREVGTLATVNHPVVVRGLRHQLDGERPHAVLEHIEGPRLSSLIRRHGRLQEQQYLPLAIEVAGALHYFRTRRRRPPRRQAQQRDHGRTGAADRPVDRAVAAARQGLAAARHRLLHVAGAGRPRDPRRPRPRGRRVGPGRHPLPRRRRLTVPSPGATPTPTGSASASPSWSRSRSRCPTTCPRRSPR